jgi:hypothetical protein
MILAVSEALVRTVAVHDYFVLNANPGNDSKRGVCCVMGYVQKISRRSVFAVAFFTKSFVCSAVSAATNFDSYTVRVFQNGNESTVLFRIRLYVDPNGVLRFWRYIGGEVDFGNADWPVGSNEKIVYNLNGCSPVSLSAGGARIVLNGFKCNFSLNDVNTTGSATVRPGGDGIQDNWTWRLLTIAAVQE